VGWRRRYKHTQLSSVFLVEGGDTLTQFVASRKRQPPTLHLEVFPLGGFVTRARRLRPAFAGALVAIYDLLGNFLKHPRTFVASQWLLIGP